MVELSVVVKKLNNLRLVAVIFLYTETKNWKSFFLFYIYKWQINLTILFQLGAQQFRG